MSRTLPFILLAVGLAASSASASNVSTFPVDPYNSTGAFEGVRYLAVDPAAAANLLQPKTPAATPGTGSLSIHNAFFSVGALYVNRLPIGAIESLDTAILSGLKPGTYEVVLVMPNLFRVAFMMSTDPSVAPIDIVPAPDLPFPVYGAPPLARSIPAASEAAPTTP